MRRVVATNWSLGRIFGVEEAMNEVYYTIYFWIHVTLKKIPFEAVWLIIDWQHKVRFKFQRLCKPDSPYHHQSCESLNQVLFILGILDPLSLSVSLIVLTTTEWVNETEWRRNIFAWKLLLKTLFNYILEDKNNNNLLMKTKSMRRWDFLSQKLLLRKKMKKKKKKKKSRQFWNPITGLIGLRPWTWSLRNEWSYKSVHIKEVIEANMLMKKTPPYLSPQNDDRKTKQFPIFNIIQEKESNNYNTTIIQTVLYI